MQRAEEIGNVGHGNIANKLRRTSERGLASVRELVSACKYCEMGYDEHAFDPRIVKENGRNQTLGSLGIHMQNIRHKLKLLYHISILHVYT